MPYSPKAACLEPGCSGRATDHGRCPRHADAHRAAYRAAHPDTRPSSAERGYHGDWPTIRARQLHNEPWCVLCWRAGRREVATDVHHVRSLRDGGTNEPINLQSLCHSHHSSITATENDLAAKGRAKR